MSSSELSQNTVLSYLSTVLDWFRAVPDADRVTVFVVVVVLLFLTLYKCNVITGIPCVTYLRFVSLGTLWLTSPGML